MSAFFFSFSDLYEAFGPGPMERGRLVVIVLFVGPLVASGVMLLGRGGREATGEG